MTRFRRRLPSARKRLLSVVIALAVAAAYAVLPPSLLPGIEGEALVHDGDTLRLGKHRMRLFGIDAPELKQNCGDENGQPWDCGQQATEFLKSLAERGPIICQPLENDKYKREVAICFQSGEDLNRQLVLNGWAVAYNDYSPRYLLEQFSAMRNKRGIWRGEFESPGEWRARHK